MYTKLIIAFNETQDLYTHIKTLSQIEADTGDISFKYLLKDAVNILEKGAACKSYGSQLVKLNNVKNLKLIRVVQYCEENIRIFKPHWQVMAEINGWMPTN